MLEELNLPYDLDERARPVSRHVTRFHKSGKVPVLLEYDHVQSEASHVDWEAFEPSFALYESVAINNYLADTYGTHLNPPLIPPPTLSRERATYDQIVSCILSELDAQGLWVYRKVTPPLCQFFDGPIPKAATLSRKQFDRINRDIFQQFLGDKGPFLLGEYFSAADILYVHCLDWAKSMQWHKPDEDAGSHFWPEPLEFYRQNCQQRPAYQRAKVLRDASTRRQAEFERKQQEKHSRKEKVSEDRRSKL